MTSPSRSISNGSSRTEELRLPARPNSHRILVWLKYSQRSSSQASSTAQEASFPCRSSKEDAHSPRSTICGRKMPGELHRRRPPPYSDSGITTSQGQGRMGSRAGGNRSNRHREANEFSRRSRTATGIQRQSCFLLGRLLQQRQGSARRVDFVSFPLIISSQIASLMIEPG